MQEEFVIIGNEPHEIEFKAIMSQESSSDEGDQYLMSHAINSEDD